MKAMLLDKIATLERGTQPLRFSEVDPPPFGAADVLIRVKVCGVCHTELDEIEGRTPPSRLPAILGHQVIGEVVAAGDAVHPWKSGERVGVAWIGRTCGKCGFCASGQENLCPQFEATGRDRGGGYAEFIAASSDYLFRIPEVYSDAQAAPLLCAGAIGYRSLRLTQLTDGQILGLMGYGSSAQRVLPMARHLFPNSPIMVFARDGISRALAREHGAHWAGDIHDTPPAPLNAAIDTTPVWRTVLAALEALVPGGRLVINAIRKEEADKPSLLQLDYPKHLWLEKEIKSVTNVTRADVADYLLFAVEAPVTLPVQEYALEDANRALEDLKFLPVAAAKVLVVS